jgi:hypothetical protein
MSAQKTAKTESGVGPSTKGLGDTLAQHLAKAQFKFQHLTGPVLARTWVR